MSEHHENTTGGFETGNYTKPTAGNAPQNETILNPATPRSAGAYTWNTGREAPPSGGYSPQYAAPSPYAPPPKPPKKRGTPFGVKLLAVILCCAVTSAAALGGFVLLIQNGVVDIEGTSNGNAAFTISRVVSGEAEETGTVSALSDQDIAEKLIPSVVCIQNYQISERFGFSQTTQDTTGVSPVGEGSGIIFSEDGYIVTNAHVISGATSLKVVLSDGMTYEAVVVGSDTATDLAVIKIDATGLTAAEFGSSSDLRVADKVIAIGNPGGMEFNSSVTIGYVSALNRAVANSSTGYTMNFIQTDAAINPGNSGGALVNEYGQVVGINSAKISATGYEGLGFAIPTDTAQPILSNLMEYGYVKDRAVLGISAQFVDSLTGRFYGLPQGMYVASLNTDNAKASGLQVYDVITAIDGQGLESEAMLKTIINAKKPGDTVKLTVYRPESGESLEVTLTLSEYEGAD